AWTLCGAPGTMFFAAGRGMADPSCKSPVVAPSQRWYCTQNLPRTLSKLWFSCIRTTTWEIGEGTTPAAERTGSAGVGMGIVAATRTTAGSTFEIRPNSLTGINARLPSTPGAAGATGARLRLSGPESHRENYLFLAGRRKAP